MWTPTFFAEGSRWIHGAGGKQWVSTVLSTVLTTVRLPLAFSGQLGKLLHWPWGICPIFNIKAGVPPPHVLTDSQGSCVGQFFNIGRSELFR